jgi:hypothetical protein
LTALLAYPVALAAALPTTLLVLALWVAHARLVDGNSADSVFWSFVFLFVPLIFAVSMFSNLLAVALGQLAHLIVPGFAGRTMIVAAGVLVWCGCAWTQGGIIRTARASAPVSAVPVALFCVTDMLILGGGLHLLPQLTFS